MEELKRCPFCGGEATVMEAVGEVWVKCSECHSSNGVSTGSRAKAIAAWNMRQADADAERYRFLCECDTGNLHYWLYETHGKIGSDLTAGIDAAMLKTPNCEITGGR